MKQMNESTARNLQSLFDNAFDLICIVDENGRFVNVNPASRRLLGFMPGELEGRAFTDFLHHEDVEKAKTLVAKQVSEKGAVKFESRFHRKDRSIICFSWTIQADKKKKQLYFFGHDVTEMHQTREKLAKCNERFFYVTQAAHDAIWDWDIINDEVYWGYGYNEFFGYDVNDPALNRAAWHTRIHPDDHSVVVESVKNAWDNGTTVWQQNYRYKKMDGSYAFVSDRAVILRNKKNRPYRMIGAMHDDTERRKAEDEIHLSEQRFKALVQSGSDLISIIDVHGNYSFHSPTIEKIMGYSPQSLRGKNAFEFIHPDDADDARAGLEKVKTEPIVHLKPFRFRDAMGKWHWIKTTLTNRVDNPAIRGIVANSKDITERKSMVEQLEYLSLVARETANPVIITDLHGKIIWVNNAFTRLYEYTLDDTHGKTPIELLSGPETKKEAAIKIRNAAITLSPEETEIIYYSKSGRKYHMEIQLQPVFDESGKPVRFFGLHHDVTVKKRLEQQLINEQKESQRRITQEVIIAQEKQRAEIGGELHDNVIQILATIKLYLDQIRSDSSKLDILLPVGIKYLNMSIDEIRKLSWQLCASYSGELDLEDSIVNLAESLNMGGKTIFKTNIAGVNNMGLSDAHKLSIYRIIQEQLNNILKYAQASEAHVSLRVSGDHLILVVKDNGVGFDTGKKGNGIGLKNIANRAALHAGTMKITSSKQNGCELLVDFDLSKTIPAPGPLAKTRS